MDERLTPDFFMVRTLEGIQDLAEQIWPGQPRKNAKPPFAFYIQTDDGEDDALDRLTGLQHTGYQLHVVAADYRKLPILGGKIKAALTALVGQVCPRADTAVCDIAVCDVSEIGTDGDALLFEDVSDRQMSPDLYEEDVLLFRRIYQVDIDYQTERSEGT